MKLTTKICDAAKAGEKRRKLSDGAGLQLWIQPSGIRLWYLVYRFQKKSKQVALGPYPLVRLSEARRKVLEAKCLLRAGVDPSSSWQRSAGDEGLIVSTFKDVALELLDKRKRENLSPVTLSKKEWLLKFAYPKLGNMPISEIRPMEVLDVLRRVERRGRYETARRLRATIGAVFRFAIATGRSEVDPTVALRDAITTPTVTPRAAITNVRQFGDLLRRIDSYDGKPIVRSALNLMALLFPRPSELRLARWSEFDLHSAIWTIPSERIKTRQEHKVPLAPQALRILEGLYKIYGHREFVLPGLHSPRKPMSGGIFNSALRNIGCDQNVMSSHGFRASASSMLNESGLWNPDAIERQLAHIEKNAVRRAYARSAFWDERIRMMAWWADYLDTLRFERGGYERPSTIGSIVR